MPTPAGAQQQNRIARSLLFYTQYCRPPSTADGGQAKVLLSTNCASASCRLGAQDAAMDAVLLHCLNHCNKAADAIKKGNEQLKGAPKGSADAPRDQGFTRPKVGTPWGTAACVLCEGPGCSAQPAAAATSTRCKSCRAKLVHEQPCMHTS
jgi:Utp25, U3 small nucleolar RNA-associated SSU processome protein 25